MSYCPDCAKLLTENRTLKTHVGELVEALQELLKQCPDCGCDAMDHGATEGDSHGLFAPCPPLRRYIEAQDKARAALERVSK